MRTAITYSTNRVMLTCHSSLKLVAVTSAIGMSMHLSMHHKHHYGALMHSVCSVSSIEAKLGVYPGHCGYAEMKRLFLIWVCPLSQVEYPVFWKIDEFCDALLKLIDHMELDKVCVWGLHRVVFWPVWCLVVILCAVRNAELPRVGCDFQLSYPA